MEALFRSVGGILAGFILLFLLAGIWQGMRRPVGRASGAYPAWLFTPKFYFITFTLFLGALYLGWQPLPLVLPKRLDTVLLLVGAGLYFPGLLCVSWGRLALGHNYFVSSSLGAQLFAGHSLVTTGPFAIIRHPMYAGLILAIVGSLLMYHTWSNLWLACLTPFMLLRARKEENLLSAEFGEQWQAYCRRVPAFLPRFRR